MYMHKDVPKNYFGIRNINWERCSLSNQRSDIEDLKNKHEEIENQLKIATSQQLP